MCQFSVGVLESHLQQEQVLAADLRVSLERERATVLRLTQQVDHRNAETADIHNQLEGAHIKVDSLQSALEQEQMRLVSARLVLWYSVFYVM